MIILLSANFSFREGLLAPFMKLVHFCSGAFDLICFMRTAREAKTLCMPSVAFLLSVISQAKALSLCLHAFHHVEDPGRRDSFPQCSTGQQPCIHHIIEETDLAFSSGRAFTRAVWVSCVPNASFEGCQFGDFPAIRQSVHLTQVD